MNIYNNINYIIIKNKHFSNFYNKIIKIHMNVFMEIILNINIILIYKYINYQFKNINKHIMNIIGILCFLNWMRMRIILMNIFKLIITHVIILLKNINKL